ncbi:hypothetical protein FACS1894147_00340 [Spirochaetia bacterium]|nr:hypothetical protein FACS1894147_00340 [Spirochaetia bacterium]
MINRLRFGDERDWAAYTAEFQRLDLARYLQIKQTAYDRQYGKK